MSPSWESFSPNMTGSTVFDLDGDGNFEVIYRDERALRIYDGRNGQVLFEDVLSVVDLQTLMTL